MSLLSLFQKVLKGSESSTDNDTGSDDLLKKGLKHHEAGDLATAEIIYRKILQDNTTCADALNLFGILKSQQTDYISAIELLNKAIECNGNQATYYNNLGTVYFNKGDFDKALVNHGKAILIEPGFVDAYFNKGNALYKNGRLQEALQAFIKALELNPGHIDAAYNKAITLRDLNEYEQSIAAFKETLSISPMHVLAMNGLARVYETIGDLENSLSLYRKALGIEPGYLEANTNLLLNLNYQVEISPDDIFTEHRNWELKHCSLPPSFKPAYSLDRQRRKRIRVGYISPDFRRHSVSFFIDSILEEHDKGRFEIYAYYTYPEKDEVTVRLQKHFEHWRDVYTLTDEQLIQQIVEDDIDILVDLTGHTAYNRLPVFARKPAPVQITYLGYPNTTGLSAIDYRITDRYADPEGKTEQYYSERLLRLDHCFICYKPPADCPDISRLPALSNSTINFGCFNNATKINDTLLSIWVELLKSVPDSTLLLKSGQYQCEILRKRIMAFCEKKNISSRRIQFAYHSNNTFEHMNFYNKVDIALDTFPYNGTTTTCDALWMGVPVISLFGNEHRSRVGLSLLTNAGMTDWAASSCEMMIEIARTAVSNLESLDTLRQNLRNKLSDSPLMDSKLLTSNIEQLYESVYDNTTT